MVTVPSGVSNETAMTPGVPFGAHQVTSSEPRTSSTGPPSHSVTRSGEPAISIPHNRTSVIRAWDGCISSSESKCTMNGNCGSEIRPFTPI